MATLGSSGIFCCDQSVVVAGRLRDGCWVSVGRHPHASQNTRAANHQAYESTYVWLRGVCPQVLVMLPDWQQSSEGTSQTNFDFGVNTAVSVIGLVVGSVLAYFYLPTTLEALSSRSWPETPGRLSVPGWKYIRPRKAVEAMARSPLR